MRYQSVWAIILHLVLTGIIIQVRYIGLIYPVVSIVVFWVAFRGKLWVAAACSIVSVGIAYWVVNWNVQAMKKLVSVPIFSSFSGWQTANNALHMIPYLDDSITFSNPRLNEIHRYVKSLPDSVYIQEGLTCDYIWIKEYPLKKYLFAVMQQRQMSYLGAWCVVSKDFDEYGKQLIASHPLLFMKSYIIPNALEFIHPSYAEAFLEYMPPPADNKLFADPKGGYPTPENNWYFVYIAPVMTHLILMLNLLYFVSLIVIAFRLKNILSNPLLFSLAFPSLLFTVVYIGASIYAAPFTVRYTLPLQAPVLLLALVAAATFFPAKSNSEKTAA